MPYSDYDDEGNLIPKVVKPVGVIPGPVDTIPPGPIATQYGDLAQHPPLINDPQYQAHGARRLLNILGGIGAGLGGHPELGRDLANAPYKRAMTDWQTKIGALTQPLHDEETRTSTALNVAKLGEKTDLDKQRETRLSDTQNENLAVKQQLADQKKLSDEAVQKWHDGEISLKELHEHFDEQDKLVKQLQAQLNEKGRNTRNSETVKGRTEDAEIVATGKNTTPAPAKAASDAILQSLKGKNPQVQRDSIDSITDQKVKDDVIGRLGEIGATYTPGPKASSQQTNQASQAITTMATINRARAELKKLPANITGPIKGRINSGVLSIGTNDGSQKTYDLQQLQSMLKLIPVSETAALAGGRATGVLVKYLTKGSGDFTMGREQLTSALDAIYQFAKDRARGQEPPEDTDAGAKAPKLKVQILK